MNWEQAVNETVSLAIESSMSNLNGSMNLSTNKTTVDPNARFSTKIPQESNAINLGPILGPCLLFVIVLLYIKDHLNNEIQTQNFKTMLMSHLSQ